MFEKNSKTGETFSEIVLVLMSYGTSEQLCRQILKDED